MKYAEKIRIVRVNDKKYKIYRWQRVFGFLWHSWIDTKKSFDNFEVAYKVADRFLKRKYPHILEIKV